MSGKMHDFEKTHSMGLSIKEELHKMIDEADEEHLGEMYGLLNDEGSAYGRYTPEDIASFTGGWKILNQVEVKVTLLRKPLI